MNGLSEITIAGQKVGLKFGMPAIRWIVEKMQQYKLVNGTASNELGVVHILYAGYQNHCAMHDTAPQIAFPAFYDYVETAGDAEESMAELASVLKEFEESRYIKAVVEADKKKAMTSPIGMKSNPSASESSGSVQESISGSPGANTSLQQKATPVKGRTPSSTPAQSSTQRHPSTGTPRKRSRR
jgi:hypothetical protein